jgi:hypothetical protein
MTEKEYFRENELDKVAAYIGMSLPTFLEARNKGKIGFRPRPKDATPVYFRCDIDRWVAGGKPPQTNSPDPAGVLAVNPNREGV